MAFAARSRKPSGSTLVDSAAHGWEVVNAWYDLGDASTGIVNHNNVKEQAKDADWFPAKNQIHESECANYIGAANTCLWHVLILMANAGCFGISNKQWLVNGW